MIYLVAVKLEQFSDIFEFKTADDRAGFIDDIREKCPSARFSTTEIRG